jgi:hypothetical protein
MEDPSGCLLTMGPGIALIFRDGSLSLLNPTCCEVIGSWTFGRLFLVGLTRPQKKRDAIVNSWNDYPMFMVTDSDHSIAA